MSRVLTILTPHSYKAALIVGDILNTESTWVMRPPESEPRSILISAIVVPTRFKKSKKPILEDSA